MEKLIKFTIDKTKKGISPIANIRGDIEGTPDDFKIKFEAVLDSSFDKYEIYYHGDDDRIVFKRTGENNLTLCVKWGVMSAVSLSTPYGIVNCFCYGKNIVATLDDDMNGDLHFEYEIENSNDGVIRVFLEINPLECE